MESKRKLKPTPFFLSLQTNAVNFKKLAWSVSSPWVIKLLWSLKLYYLFFCFRNLNSEFNKYITLMSIIESMGTVEPWWLRVSIDKWKPWRKHITLQVFPFNRGSSQDRPGLLRAAVYIASLLPRHWESALLKSPTQVRRDIHAAAALLPSVPRSCHPLRIFYIHAHVYISIHSWWILNKTGVNIE